MRRRNAFRETAMADGENFLVCSGSRRSSSLARHEYRQIRTEEPKALFRWLGSPWTGGEEGRLPLSCWSLSVRPRLLQLASESCTLPLLSGNCLRGRGLREERQEVGEQSGGCLWQQHRQEGMRACLKWGRGPGSVEGGGRLRRLFLLFHQVCASLLSSTSVI